MRRWLAVLAVLLVPAVLPAQEVKLPDGVQEIKTAELKAKMDAGGKLAVINSLSPLEFTQTKIKGAVNLPYGHLRDGEVKLPADKEMALVFYCLGPK